MQILQKLIINIKTSGISYGNDKPIPRKVGYCLLSIRSCLDNSLYALQIVKAMTFAKIIKFLIIYFTPMCIFVM